MRNSIITAGVLIIGILIGLAGTRFGERVTIASLAPDDATRVWVVELPRFIDRNIAVKVEDIETGNVTTVFTSPDEGRPVGSERIVWAADSSRFVLLGRHFYVLPEARLPGGESLYLLYDIRSGKLWSNAAQQTSLPAFSRGDLEGTEWSSGFDGPAQAATQYDYIATTKAATQYDYVATTKAPRAAQQGAVRAGSLTWDCQGNQCRISGPWPTPGFGACQALAKRIGYIQRYGHVGRYLNQAELNKCNEGIMVEGVEPTDGDAVNQQSPATLYASCDGNPFYVENSCTSESCVAPGLERTIYDEWKKQFMAIQQLSEEAFSKRILLSDVTIHEGPEFVFWTADYVFVFDWVRSRQNTVVNLGKFPLAVEPDGKRVVNLIKTNIREDRKYNIDSVLTVAEVSNTFESCAENIEIDWCHIDFENVSGRLLIRGSAEVVEGSSRGRLSRPSQLPEKDNILPDQGGRAWRPGDPPIPTCVSSTVDIVTGKHICRRTPCWISNAGSQGRVPS